MPKHDKALGQKLMKEYVEKRRRKLNKRDEDKIERVAARITQMATKKNVWLASLETNDGRPGWEVVYDRIIANMQRGSLTINFEAENWFSNENTYETYATTYQKNKTEKDGKMALKSQYQQDGTPSESASERMGADQKVTIPESWKDASRLHPQRRRLYKAMTTGDKHKKKPDGKSAAGFSLQDYTAYETEPGKQASLIDNRRFNLHTKQVFAALNAFGRRNGANVYYGMSFLTLKPELKRKAIYFPKDTFNVAMDENAVDQQCTFETMGAVLAYCEDELAEDLWNACYAGQTCENTPSMKRMIEAHVFAEVKMAEHVESITLSQTTARGDTIPMEKWTAIIDNAATWSRKNSVKVLF